MSRIIAIGDLHGAADALEAILRGTRLVDRTGHWRGGGGAHLVQVGDIFNRGTEGRSVFERLLALQPEARAAGGDVTMLLGNHDVMMATGDEAWSSVDEYLSFASRRERESWPKRSQKQLWRLYRAGLAEPHVIPVNPRHDAWKVENVPGKDALRRAFGPTGRIGRALRRQPVAVQIDDTIFVHAGISLEWVDHGIDGLNALARQAWRQFDSDQDTVQLYRSVLAQRQGPLWHRPYARSTDRSTERELATVLSKLGARRTVGGHTRTDNQPGGRRGEIRTRLRRRYVGIDVSLRDDDSSTWAALVIDRTGGSEWRYDKRGRQRLWTAR
ncbi:MAG: metallophosphoesterase [Acidobacteriota bacterium]|nr:metallophosphoesterase [Acidobacteriota bacterium]